MDNADEQFQELLTHLVGQANKVLSEHGRMLPLGLILGEDKAVALVLGAAQTALDMPTVVRAIQASLRERVAQTPALATCIAFPHDAQTVIAMLETRENDCATVSIPVLDGLARSLDKDKMQIDEGRIHVFPVIEDE